MAHLILFDQETERLNWVDCNDLEDYYKHLKCRCFDIVSSGIEDLDVYVDDEGLLVNKTLSALDENLQPALVGNLIFARHNEEGETVDCTEADMGILKERIIQLVDVDRRIKFKVMCLGG